MTDNIISPFLFSFYENLPRQGPGDEHISRAILKSLSGLPDKPDIIDMGCGTGVQTMILAEKGRVAAVDIHQPFLDTLLTTATKKNLNSRITPHLRSMDDTSGFHQVDLIWSEGAVYLIGFEHGIRLWWNLIKPGGYLVVSELTQLVKDPPKPAKEFWIREYPGVQTREENRHSIKRVGYHLLQTREIPHKAWIEFYAPQKEKISQIRRDFLSSEQEVILEDIEREIQIQEDYPNTYGYVFYVMQRPSDE